MPVFAYIWSGVLAVGVFVVPSPMALRSARGRFREIFGTFAHYPTVRRVIFCMRTFKLHFDKNICVTNSNIIHPWTTIGRTLP
jgi:hypothetical protein